MLQTFGRLPQQDLDLSITHFLNQFAQQSKLWDMLMVKLIDAEVFKGGVAMAVLWWMWFHSREERNQERQFVLPTILMSMVALLVARSLAYVLPFRPRPVLDPGIDLLMPLAQTHPGLFYPGLFLLTYQIATLFTDVRSLGHVVLDALRGTL